MITKPRVATILNLALPVTVGLSTSFIMTMVDLAMVGRLGTAAVAAVGLGGFSYALISAFMAGFAPAVQGIVSRRMGEGSKDPKCLPLNGGLLMALVTGIPLTVLCYWLTPWFFSVIASDPEVEKIGVPYLRALLIGLTATGLDNAFQGHWAGVGRTKVYMMNVLFVNLLHVFLNYAFIFGHFGAPELGAVGAGVSSTIAVYVSMAIYVVVTLASYRKEGFLRMIPKADLIGRMIQIGVPAMFEMAFFSLGFVAFYWIVGRMGTPELAATNVLVRISLLMDLFAQALGMASVTLVSKTLGEGDPEGAAEWGWDVAKMGVVWITLLGIPLVIFPQECLAIFLADPATVSIAIIPAQLTGAFLGIASVIYIFASTLIALGDGKRVVIVSFTTQWIFFLPGVWVVGVMMHGGLMGITLVQLAYGLIATALITAIWSDGRWKKITI
jgi:MATE family multidrug resistance protein